MHGYWTIYNPVPDAILNNNQTTTTTTLTTTTTTTTLTTTQLLTKTKYQPKPTLGINNTVMYFSVIKNVSLLFSFFLRFVHVTLIATTQSLVHFYISIFSLKLLENNMHTSQLVYMWNMDSQK